MNDNKLNFVIGANVCALFFTLSFCASLFFTRSWFAEDTHYYTFVISQLAMVVVCLLAACYPAFGKERGRYFLFLGVTASVSLIGATVASVLEIMLGTYLLWIGSVIVVGLMGISLIIRQLFRK